MNRFRPNLVVRGPSAYEEDSWAEVRIGEAIFRGGKPCARCAVPTIDQQRGEPDGPEPLATLATYRRQDGNIFFGQNLLLDRPAVCGSAMR